MVVRCTLMLASDVPDAAFDITPVRSAADLEATVQLFKAYAASLAIDLAYQDFAAELAGLPGKYAPPAGELLLARDLQGRPSGCVGLRPLASDGRCEIKRLYVLPAGRGRGLGKRLIDTILEAAARIGYREVLLDTLPEMVEAIDLYRRSGFEVIAPYYETPVAGTTFMRRSLVD